MSAVSFLDPSEGYAELGMWHEAWVGLDGLPSDQRQSAAALRLRLRCCPGLGAWTLGEHLASLLRQGGPLERNAVASFYHANARRLLKAGDKPAAAASVQAAVETWPDYRLALLLDSVLVEEFFDGDSLAP